MTGPEPLPPLATKEQYEAMTGTAAPANIDDLLNAASAGIRRYCGWHIAPNLSDLRVLDATGGRTLVLPTLRLNQIESLSEVFGSTIIEFNPTTDLIYSRTGRVQKANYGYWGNGLANIRVKMMHGFDLADVADLSQLILSTVARSVANPYGYTSQAVGGVTLSMGSAGSGSGVSFTDTQAYLLDSYRLERQP